jgi:dynein heavy chain
VKIHEKFSAKGWQLDKTTIFAQIDAFIQRCKDLIDVNLKSFLLSFFISK